MVTVLGEGKAGGSGVETGSRMVPVPAEPPVTPLTCQVTGELEVPVTVAVNCAVVPMRVWVTPVTETTAGAGVGVLELVLLPEQPKVSRETRDRRDEVQTTRLMQAAGEER